jgi:hypothetical protein
MTPPACECELVVARYREDLAWLRRVPSAVRITVYDKSGEPSPHPALPNVGNESHSYLHHIVSHWDRLAGVTVFAQGRPFDHVPDFHRLLRRIARGDLVVPGFLWLGFVVDCDDREGTLLREWSKNREGRALPMDTVWPALWPGPVPDRFVFYPGGHFAATAGQIRRRPRDFYERALALITEIPDAGHCIERCWDRIFDADGVAPEHRAGPFPVYFRPIRRLGLTWESVPVPPHGDARTHPC